MDQAAVSSLDTSPAHKRGSNCGISSTAGTRSGFTIPRPPSRLTNTTTYTLPNTLPIRAADGSPPPRRPPKRYRRLSQPTAPGPLRPRPRVSEPQQVRRASRCVVLEPSGRSYPSRNVSRSKVHDRPLGRSQRPLAVHNGSVPGPRAGSRGSTGRPGSRASTGHQVWEKRSAAVPLQVQSWRRVPEALPPPTVAKHLPVPRFSSAPLGRARHCCAAVPLQVHSWMAVPLAELLPLTSMHLPSARRVPLPGRVQLCAPVPLHVYNCSRVPSAVLLCGTS